MKIFEKILIVLIIVSSLLSISQFMNINLPITNVSCAANIKINTINKTLNVGKKYTLKISGTKKKIKWSSSNTKIATVSSKGKVTAKKKGKCTITAKIGKKKYKCIITVKQTKSANFYITNTGKKYHKIGCKYLKKSKIKISLKEAKSQGFTACKVCKP